MKSANEFQEKSSSVADAIRRDIFDRFPAELRARITVFGGAVRDSFLDKKINDYDLMVVDIETEFALMAFLKARAETVSVTARHANYVFEGKNLQLLRGFYFPANAKTVALISDYTICCCAVTLDSIDMHVDFFSDLAEKRLRLNRVSFPLATLERLQKFATRGFLADHGTLLDLASAIQNADLEDLSLVKTQLPNLGGTIQ